jgi:hypothetical protein
LPTSIFTEQNLTLSLSTLLILTTNRLSSNMTRKSHKTRSRLCAEYTTKKSKHWTSSCEKWRLTIKKILRRTYLIPKRKCQRSTVT